jgi:hypothetical protein
MPTQWVQILHDDQSHKCVSCHNYVSETWAVVNVDEHEPDDSDIAEEAIEWQLCYFCSNRDITVSILGKATSPTYMVIDQRTKIELCLSVVEASEEAKSADTCVNHPQAVIVKQIVIHDNGEVLTYGLCAACCESLVNELAVSPDYTEYQASQDGK